jgi:glucose 1-dehydrogenase
MTRPVLLITGASSGIGAATARLAAPDWDLALGYNSNRDGVEAVADTCRGAGARVLIHQGDLSRPEAVESMFAAVDAAFGRLDGLVNNAGIVHRAQRVDEYDAARVERLVATNLTGPILVAGAAVRRMSTRHGGAGGGIVNISSVAARLTAPGQYVDYAATKGAIDVLTKGLALEVAGEGIRVNAIRPGIIETPIHGKGGDAERVERLAPQIPMGRPGSAEEVARAVLWLLSEAASYVTGDVMDVTGGR